MQPVNSTENKPLPLLSKMDPSCNIQAMPVESPATVTSVLEEFREAVGRAKNSSWPLHTAAIDGRADVVRVLVREFGALVEVFRWSDGWAPLHLAAAEGHVDVVRVLVELGANVSTARRGRTYLHAAATCARAYVAPVFRGGSSRSRNDDGWAPLHCAASKGRAETVRVLVKELGAVVNVVGVHGWTPLHSAAAEGHPDTVRVLVRELGMDVNSEQNDGWAPLHWATAKGHVDVSRVLVELGANVNIKTSDGWTPLHTAATKGRANTARQYSPRIGAGARCGRQQSAERRLDASPYGCGERPHRRNRRPF